MINKILYSLYVNFRSIITWGFWGYVAVLLALFLIDVKLNAYCFIVLFFFLGLWVGSSLSYWLRDEIKYRELDK